MPPDIFIKYGKFSLMIPWLKNGYLLWSIQCSERLSGFIFCSRKWELSIRLFSERYCIIGYHRIPWDVPSIPSPSVESKTAIESVTLNASFSECGINLKKKHFDYLKASWWPSAGIKRIAIVTLEMTLMLQCILSSD